MLGGFCSYHGKTVARCTLGNMKEAFYTVIMRVSRKIAKCVMRVRYYRMVYTTSYLVSSVPLKLKGIHLINQASCSI